MSQSFGPPPPAISTGLACKCPRCGQGSIFKSFLEVRDTCPVCELDISAIAAGDGPAVFIIFILGAVVVPIALWVDSLFAPPLWLHAILWGTVVIGGTIAMLRPLKGVTIALQYRHKTPGQ